MEYLDGETVDQMLRRRGLIPSEEAIPLFKQALLGIGFAHRMGIVHRDIKPSNIMTNRYGVIKVTDFGIAKVLGGQRLTRTGTQIGTVAYTSPEQIRNRPVDIRSDIYSLGVTLYEILTAHLPFESDSDYQVMSDHVNLPPPPPTRHYPYIPRGIEQCVLKALEKNPDDRFQTVEDFGSALEHTNGIEQWLAARPAQVAPRTLHTGGTPPPVSLPAVVTTSMDTPRIQGTNPASHPIAQDMPALPSSGSTPAPNAEANMQRMVPTVPSAVAPGSIKHRRLLVGAIAVFAMVTVIGSYRVIEQKRAQRDTSGRTLKLIATLR